MMKSKILRCFLILLFTTTMSAPSGPRAAAQDQKPDGIDLSKDGILASLTTRVSVKPGDPVVEGDDHSEHPAISPDSRYIAFTSIASNLVNGDINAVSDIFLYDRQENTLVVASLGDDETWGTGGSDYASLSADGRYIAFESWADNLVPGDTNDESDVFVRDLVAGTTVRISVTSAGGQGDGTSAGASISSDGRYVSFYSYATNLVAGDTNNAADVFRHDLQTGTTIRVSVDSSGAQTIGGDAWESSISLYGERVAFYSEATNLVANDDNGYFDVFVHDVPSGETWRVSVAENGTQGDGDSQFPSISNDGAFVAFESEATTLVPGDAGGFSDVFVYDLEAGTIELVSKDTGGVVQANDDSFRPTISDNGRFVAFSTYADNLTDDDFNTYKDIYSHDRHTGETKEISRSSNNIFGNGNSDYAGISADGRWVTFYSTANNLVGDDNNGKRDVFLRYRDDVIGYKAGGHVVDQRGNPILDVKVSVDVVGLAYTNVDGLFGFYDIGPGTYTFKPVKYGYKFAPVMQDRTLPPDALDINFVGYHQGIELDCHYGQKGDIFTVTGSYFPFNEAMDVVVNDVKLGEVMTDGGGDLIFTLDTDNADLGFYLVEVGTEFYSSDWFVLDNSGPHCTEGGGGGDIPIPPGIGKDYQAVLPLVSK